MGLTLESAPALFGPYGRGLSVGPIEEAPQASEGVWLTGDRLLETVEPMVTAFAVHGGLEDLPAAASAWAKHHAAALVPGVLVATTLDGVGIDVAPANTAFHVVDRTVRTARILDPTRIRRDDEGFALVTTTLFRDHLAPLYRRVARETGISEKILWGNVGNYLAYLYDVLADAHPGMADIVAHRTLLLDAEVALWSDGVNPLKDPVRYDALDAPGLPERVQVRRTCCLKLRIRDRVPCTTCPSITTGERIALLRRAEAAR